MSDTNSLQLRKIYRRGLLDCVVVGVLFLLMSSMAIASGYDGFWVQANSATAPQSETNAKPNSATSSDFERLKYIADMRRLQHEWLNSNIIGVMQILEETRSSKERNFEWYYWHNLCYGHTQYLENTPEDIQVVAFSPDRTQLVIGGKEHSAYVWDVTAGKKRLTLNGHEDSILGVAYSADGKLIATGSADGRAKLWDASTGNLLMTTPKSERSINTVAFSYDGKRLVAGGSDRTARIWETSTGKELLSLPDGHEITGVLFSPNDRQIVTCGDGQGKLWDATTGHLLFEMPGQRKGWAFPVFSPNGIRLIILSDGTELTGEMAYWDTTTGRKFVTLSKNNLTGKNMAVTAAAFTQDGSRLITTGPDGSVKYWDNSGNYLYSLPVLASGRGCLTVSVDNSQLLVVGKDRIRTYRIDQPFDVLTFRDSGITAAFSPDGRYLVTGRRVLAMGDGFPTPKGEVKLWQVATGRVLRSIKEHRGSVAHVVFSPDGRHFASGGIDGKIFIWDVPTGAKHIAISYSSSSFRSGVTWINYSADSTKLIVGYEDGSASVYNADNGKKLIAFKKLNRFVIVGLSPDGKLATVGYEDASEKEVVKILIVATGKVLRTIRDASPIAAFSPDGKSIATASYNGHEAHIWAVRTGQKQLTLHGKHISCILSFSPDGKRIVTASYDKIISVFDAQTGLEILTLKDDEPVNSAYFSADGSKIFTTSGIYAARVWLSDAPTKLIH